MNAAKHEITFIHRENFLAFTPASSITTSLKFIFCNRVRLIVINLPFFKMLSLHYNWKLKGLEKSDMQRHYPEQLILMSQGYDTQVFNGNFPVLSCTTYETKPHFLPEIIQVLKKPEEIGIYTN